MVTIHLGMYQLPEDLASPKRRLADRVLTTATLMWYNNRIAVGDCYMKIGFTGTRKGMTDFQKKEVGMVLTFNRPTEVHHGDCIGADTNFHNICLGFYPIIIHPSNLRTRAWNKGAIITHVPKPPIARDHDIVDAVDIMVATPKGQEILRSGTWATIRYCKKRGKIIHIIYPKL